MRQTFEETDILPIEFSYRATFCDRLWYVEIMPKLCLILLHFVVHHSVDAVQQSTLIGEKLRFCEENIVFFHLSKILTFNMFHVFALTYYILLCCVTCEYSMTSVTTKNYSIYATRKSTLPYSICTVLFITRGVYETCFCCRSCNGRFFLNCSPASWWQF